MTSTSAMSAKPSSSIHSIPPEILLRIFNDFVQEHQRSPAYNSITADGGVWAIRDVCREWRAIVDGASSLWSYIRLVAEPDVVYPRLRKSPEEIISFQLAQSKNAALRIHIQAPASASLPTLFRTLAILVSEHHHRWQTVTIHDSDALIYDALVAYSLAPMHCPLLERLELLGAGASEYNERLFAEQGCPLLRNTHLTGISGFFSSPALLLPWSQIESLELTRLNALEEFILILSRFSSLRSLSISYCWMCRTLPLVGPNLLPHLHTLVFMDTVASSVLCNITAPALEKLDLFHNPNAMRNAFLPDAVSLTAFINRSQCSIKQFICTYDGVDFQLFHYLLANMGELNHLSTIIYAGAGKLAESLIRTAGESLQYCPRLYHLEIMLDATDFRSDLDTVMEVLVGMLEFRSQPSAGVSQPCLREVKLRIVLLPTKSTFRLTSRTKNTLIKMKGRGLKIVVELREFDTITDLLSL